MNAAQHPFLFAIFAFSLPFFLAAAASATPHASTNAPGSTPSSTPEQSVSSGDEEEGGLGAVSFAFGGVARSELADTPASYALSGFEIGAALGPVGASFKRLSFDWHRAGDFTADTQGLKPWGDLDETSVALNWGGLMTKRISYLVMGGLTSGYEDQTDDSFYGMAGGMFLLSLSSNWSASAGAILSHHPKVSTHFDFMPVLGVAWRAEAANGLSVSLGLPTTEIAWVFRPGTRLVLDFSTIEGGLYRLADDNPLRPGGYVEFDNSSLALRFETLLWNRLGLSFGVGQALDREINLYDSHGKNKKSYDIENQPGFLASISMAF